MSRVAHARSLFDGIADRYDRPAEALSFGQYARWRRALVASLPLTPGDRVLDVATGTGLIARAVRDRWGARVIGVDQSEGMLAAARERGGFPLIGATAARLPLADRSVDCVIFSYLLRYVDDPAAVLRELARVLRSGGRIGSVEFGMPRAALPRAGWRAYTHGVLPMIARPLSPGWREVGSFLGPSIEEWMRQWPIERQVDAWRAAGIDDVRWRALTFGAGIVMTGRKHGG